MRTLKPLLVILLIAAACWAHPGGGMIAVDGKTVIFGDPLNNVLWWMEYGRPPRRIFDKFHVHWTTLGLDGSIYAESFGEMGGALFRFDAKGAKPGVRVAEEKDLNAHSFAVGRDGHFIFQKGQEIVQRDGRGRITRFRGFGRVAKGERELETVIAYAWGDKETLYISDNNRLRRIGKDGVIRIVAEFTGQLLEPQIWNTTGRARVWSIAPDRAGRVFVALSDLAQVVRIDPDGSRRTITTHTPTWRPTAVAVHEETLFILEYSDISNDGPRVRALTPNGSFMTLGKIEL